jgi:hypothetical protein
MESSGTPVGGKLRLLLVSFSEKSRTFLGHAVALVWFAAGHKIKEGLGQTIKVDFLTSYDGDSNVFA